MLHLHHFVVITLSKMVSHMVDGQDGKIFRKVISSPEVVMSRYSVEMKTVSIMFTMVVARKLYVVQMPQ